MNADMLKELEPIFFPRSIAVVGASSNRLKFGTGYLNALIDTGYQGGLYPVHPSEGEISGLKAYPRVRDIPGPVDYVIVSIPAQYTLDLMDDCVAKGVQVIQFFTAGFSETGEEEGIELERELVRRAKAGGVRIIGPNCIGVYSPANRMPYGMMSWMGEPGTVGFISQSGGHGGGIIEAGIRRGIGFSKLVSFGNGCDLNSIDYLEYFAQDPETAIIGGYLEGIPDGRRFFRLAREVSGAKPLIIWKGGRTTAGAEAAASHTASLAIPDTIWSAMLRQAGVVRVDSLEELADTLLTFQHYPPFYCHQAAIVAGLAGGGGGESVSSTDACASMGIDVPPFTADARGRLKALMPPAGAILRNPLDMGGGGGNLDVLRETMEIIVAEPQIDIIVINAHIDNLASFLSMEVVNAMNDIFIHFRKAQRKPIVVVCRPGMGGSERLEQEAKLGRAGIPIYPSLDRAAQAIANMNQYYQYHHTAHP